METSDILRELSKPFHPSKIEFKPGATSKTGKGLALAFADLRAYQNRLDEVLGTNWSVKYQPWGDGRIICTIKVETDRLYVERSSTGEVSAESERGEIGGTVAEAQAFKRACAMFGLGRYLYEFPQVWIPMDGKRFTDAGLARLKASVIKHYHRHGQPEGEVNDTNLDRAEEVPV